MKSVESDPRPYSLEEINVFFRKNDAVGGLLGLEVKEATPEYAVTTIPMDERHTNGLKTAHGAAIFLVADLAFGAGCAANGVYCVNAQTSISYLNPGLKGPITAEARLIKKGRKLMSFDITVTDGHGSLVAKGIITGYNVGSLNKYIDQKDDCESA